MRLELSGIELQGFHGVLEDERREGQRFRFDVAVETAEPAEDDIDAAVDYRDLVACVREISDGTHFQLLETLAASVADELKRRFALEPLLDLDPELAIPGRGRVSDLLAGLH